MSLPAVAVRRPITVMMATLAVTTFGFLAARRLPVELLPDLSYPTLTVQTSYPDAAPVSVEQFVTRPVEEALGVIPGVREMRSTSRSGLSEVILEFEWDEEMDFAAMEVRDRLGLVELPREAEPSRVLRFDPTLDPILRLAFSGDRPLDELRQLADRWLKQRLEAVRGVAAAKVRGGLDPEVLVEADEDRLAALGLTLDDLATALAAENVNQPGGQLKDFNAVYLVRTLHEFVDLDQLRRTVVRERDGTRVRVEDVATVTRGHRDRDEITRLDGREVVELALHREGSANTVAVAQEVRAELDRLAGEMPEDLEITVLTDQSLYISAAVGQVWNAALLGGILAILVLYFFLRDPVATAIIGLSIPVSIVATFLPMQQAGVSLNIMSLGGLALGIGMLVDNSIVVLEAIDRRRREGASRREAAVLGASEVAGAVTAATLTTLSVFFPIVFVEGIAGQLFRDQALTICFSLLTSLVVSLSLIPSLAAFDPEARRREAFRTLFVWDADPRSTESLPWTVRLGPLELPPVGDGRHWASRLLTVLLFPLRLAAAAALAAVAALGWGFRRLFGFVTAPLARGFDAVGRVYPGLLRRALARRWTVVGVAVALFAASIAAVPWLGTNLVPDLAQGEFAFQLRLPEGTPVETTAETVGRIEAQLAGRPPFQRVFSLIGSLPSAASGRRTLGENLAQINFDLGEG
ncbi:MAG: efflux RND transporter permease subunit, partial [Thermoanaerobaculia bacterium]|nr:efflux RND transporter permease subunit [Thermoanaerobaculia bacterium]